MRERKKKKREKIHFFRFPKTPLRHIFLDSLYPYSFFFPSTYYCAFFIAQISLLRSLTTDPCLFSPPSFSLALSRFFFFFFTFFSFKDILLPSNRFAYCSIHPLFSIFFLPLSLRDSSFLFSNQVVCVSHIVRIIGDGPAKIKFKKLRSLGTMMYPLKHHFNFFFCHFSEIAAKTADPIKFL